MPTDHVPPARPPTHPPPGTVLGDRYRIEELLDEGAMGRVFRGEHIHMRKRVAIKVLRRELTQVPEVMARFEREAMAAAHIEHPNIAAATDFGKLPDGSVYLVLEFVEGRTLRKEIDAGPLSIPRALKIARQIAAALAAAHALDIVHRDLKPENVMLVQRGVDRDFVKVLDFGVAKVPIDVASAAGVALTGSSITKAGMVFGTPDYMAPEQALGQDVDSRADLYSLGVLLFEMIAGVRPFKPNQELGILGQQLASGPPAFSARAGSIAVPVEVEKLVRSLLVNEASEREGPAERVAALITERLASLGEETIPLAVPLNLASPLADAAPAAASGVPAPRLSDRVRSVLPAPIQGLPVWGLVVLPIVALGGLAGLLLGWEEESPSPEAVAPASASAPAASAETAPPPTSEPSLEQATEAQLAEASKAGKLALDALHQRFPNDGHVLVARARFEQKAGAYTDAVADLDAAIELEPAVVDSAHLKSAMWTAVQRKGTETAAWKLLTEKLGAVGADIVLDLATHEKVRPDLSDKSKRWLTSKRFDRVSSPEANIAAALLVATECKVRSGLLKRAENVGDARSLPVLERFLAGAGCLKSEPEPCNACLDKPAIQAAIAAIRGRIPKEGG